MKRIKQFIATAVSMAMLFALSAYMPVSALTSADLSISQNGIEFICSLEGFHSTCYVDSTQSSIGYGTKCTGSSVQPHTAGSHSITREQAMSDMKSQIENTYSPRVRTQTSGITMNQNQFDALVSLCYNCGGGTSRISNSPLVKYLKGELTESEARSQYSSYIVTSGGSVLQGLINRRNKEADLFFSGEIASLVTPTITTDKTSYTVGDTVYLSWTASPSNSNLSHYWLIIDAPDGTRILNETMSLNTSYSFAVSQVGNYTITSFATPQGSADGSGSLTDMVTISVESYPGIPLKVTPGSNITNTEFNWGSTQYAISYGLRIYEDENWNNQVYSVWDIASTTHLVILPAGNYMAQCMYRTADDDWIFGELVHFVINTATTTTTKTTTKPTTTTTTTTTTITTTTQTQSSSINYDIQLSFETVEITLEELEKSDYTVKVPVYITGSGGWYKLGWGASWETNKLTMTKITSGNMIYSALQDNIECYSLPSVNNDLGKCWTACVVTPKGNETLYVEDGHVATMVFKVNTSAKAGDVYIIQALLKSNGEAATIGTADGTSVYDVNSAAIIIKSNTTTTTTPTTTTTTSTTTSTTTKTTKTTTSTTTTVASDDFTVVYGDINLDNIVSMSDLVYLNKAIAKILTLNTEQSANADCVVDGIISTGDAQALLKFLVLSIKKLPIIPQ